MAFCDFVRNLRDRNHLTQAQIAKYLDVNVNTIKQIEAKKIKTPSNRVLDSFCNYLKEDRLTIMTNILFKRNDIVKDVDRYTAEQENVLSRYISYLYLEGWNIDKAPAVFHTEDIGELTYASQLTKKREPHNKIVVDSISATFSRDKDYISSDEAISFITSSMAAFFCIDEVLLKGIHILFNAQDKNERKLFSVFKKLKINKVPFNYQMILFDSVVGKVLDIKDLK